MSPASAPPKATSSGGTQNGVLSIIDVFDSFANFTTPQQATDPWASLGI